MNVDMAADRLFASVMAPLVLGGEIAPVLALGERLAWSLGDARGPSDPRTARVSLARLQRARALAPVDWLQQVTTPEEWALAAACHDLLVAANPGFCKPFRRRAARRILDSALSTLERVPLPANVREALSRHTWFARVLEIQRTDSEVSWWSETRHFLGREPPARLQAWSGLRQVSVVRTRRALLDLAPIAVDRAAWSSGMASLLARSPLTDLATCTRTAPPFTWNASVLALVRHPAGRTLGLRALDRSSPVEVDAALGRATRDLLARAPRTAGPALEVLANRALALVVVGDAPAARSAPPAPPRASAPGPTLDPTPPPPDAIFARALGAAIARRTLRSSADAPGQTPPRADWLQALDRLVRASPEVEHLRLP